MRLNSDLKVSIGDTYISRKNAGSIKKGEKVTVEGIENSRILVCKGPYALTKDEFISIFAPDLKTGSC